MAHDVFVSYAHQDRTVANAVVATLEAHGIRCWIAPRDILPGSDWGEAILDAIKEAQALVLVFSSSSNDSDQIKREVERTVHQGIAVIPFRIEDVLPNKTLEYFISTQHWLDALTPPLEDHLKHLAETITVLLAKKGGKEKPLHAGGEEPAPPQPPSHPEVTIPGRAPVGHHGQRPSPEISLDLVVLPRRPSRRVSGSRRDLVAMVAASGGNQRSPPPKPPNCTPNLPNRRQNSRQPNITTWGTRLKTLRRKSKIIPRLSKLTLITPSIIITAAWRIRPKHVFRWQ